MQEFLQEDREEKDNSGLEWIDLDNDSTELKKITVDDEEIAEESFNWFREILGLLGTMAIAAVTVLLLKEFVIINAYIPSSSMEYTISPGDRVIGNRLAYLSEEPERGDIIIFKYPDDETQLFVKRVIGLPGETVVIEDANVYVGEERFLLEE